MRSFVPALVISAACIAGVAKAQNTTCQASLLMDASTGEIIESKDSETPRPPASMVKLMTAYTVMKRVEEGVLKLDELVTTSAFASKVGGSQVYLKQGEQFTVDDLIDAILVQSANDGAVALAEHIGGTTEGFVVMMNEEANRLGMTQSKFHFPHGLPPAQGQEPDLVSPRDFGILSRAIIKDFPQLLERTKIVEKPFRGGEFIMRNHNRLLQMFPGADGLKTGFYGKAGFSVAATAERNGVRMIAIVMGCDKRPDRERETSRLLSVGFTKYRISKLASKGEPSPQSVSIAAGDPSVATPVLADDVKGVIRVGSDVKVEQKAELCTGLMAPVAANTPCGELVFTQGGKVVARAPLIIPNEVAKASIWKRAYNTVYKLIAG